MKDLHPGGIPMTHRLLAMAGLTRPGDTADRALRILDMGAGNGQTIRLLRDMGFAAEGIDKSPGVAVGDLPVHKGDFFHCPFADEAFDIICSECAFYISGDARTALKGAARLLKKHGRLLLADVSFVSSESHIQRLQEAGFSVLALEDITPLWKEYYISRIWEGTADQLCGCLPKGKCSYYLTVCERM